MMEFAKLIEYAWEIFFFFENVVEKNIPRPFSKKWQLRDYFSGSIGQSFAHFVFILYQVEGYQNILKLSWNWVWN